MGAQALESREWLHLNMPRKGWVWNEETAAKMTQDTGQNFHLLIQDRVWERKTEFCF